MIPAEMAVTREVYISAVEGELRTAREIVAARLAHFGYHPVWHDYPDGNTADIRALVAGRIRRCKAVIQLVGDCYGQEPPPAQQLGGRTSYTQYEALCARAADQPVWHFLVNSDFPREPSQPTEPADLTELQLTYRRRVQSAATNVQPISSMDELRAAIDILRPDLLRICRRSTLRRLRRFLARFGFQNLNGHPADETSRAQA